MTDLKGKPEWLRVRAGLDRKYIEIRELLKSRNLHTVCHEANCPNRGECFSSGTATFLIMGPNCTRNCRFCNVTHGGIKPLNDDEPLNIAETVALMELRHAVITSVTRDDLNDGGAKHFALVIKAVRDRNPRTKIEVLTPDFCGEKENVEIVFKAGPDVFNHNIETVPRLYSDVRPQADYGRSLQLLEWASQYGGMAVKSGLMVGLGETVGELSEVFCDMFQKGVQYLTIGQYLAPSKDHYPIVKYYTPEEFNSLAEMALKAGIVHVFSAPLVRSSYHAGERHQS